MRTITSKCVTLLVICMAALCCSCSNSSPLSSHSPTTEDARNSKPEVVKSKPTATPKSQSASRLDSLGLVDISEVDSTIKVDLIYAQANNFMGDILYDDLREAYLHQDAAKALLMAHRILKERHPSYRFIVYDAARPMSVQQKMWDKVKRTEKYIYVSNPARGGGLHNYGLAVDISIADSQGNPLPMGTEVDHFGPEAHIYNENELVKQGKISTSELANRQLLRQVMSEAGFKALPNEWWHFNLCSRNEARRSYTPIP